MFAGDLAFLSNFDLTPFHVPVLGTEVASAEHAFNALKTSDPDEQGWVLSAPTPSTAKERGRNVSLRPGWDNGARVWAMQRVLVAKFAVPVLRARLMKTGTVPLIETNWWHDQFWGTCFCPRHETIAGTNMLGELLMALRARPAD